MKRTVNFVLQEMRVKGSTLHCSFERGKAVWFLSSDQQPLTDGVGVAASHDPHVVDVGDTLLHGICRGQAFRYSAVED